ncbi:DUF7503 family protein [Halomicrobium mukohataei]|nr:hypothetical protein [Halomicrobium mukohataei]
MSQTQSVKDTLASHPKLIGMIFTVLLLLTQVGSAAATTGASTFAGP